MTKWSIVRGTPCPCGSGRAVEKCCWHNGILRLRETKTRLTRPKTGYINPSCYASPLEDCSNKISREHYKSGSILEAIDKDWGLVVGNLPWLVDRTKAISPKALTSKILCERHNSALSPLDTVALRFFNAFDTVTNDLGVHPGHDRMFLFNGHDIERWILKVLCGSVYSKNAALANGPYGQWSPEQRWLRILFGQERIPKGWGLYFPAEIGTTTNYESEVATAPISNSQGVYGSILMIKTFKFILCMMRPPKSKRGTLLDNAIYRPSELIINSGNHKTTIFFYWDVKGDNRGIAIDLINRIAEDIR